MIGIAVSMASGVNANYGTMTKPCTGHAARNGIVAAMLGSRGFTANAAAIEGRGGFAQPSLADWSGTRSRFPISAAPMTSPSAASGSSAIPVAAWFTPRSTPR